MGNYPIRRDQWDTPKPEPVVQVCRSRLDPEVWLCVPVNFEGACTADFLSSAGRLRAVKRYAEKRFGDDAELEFRWVRRDPDTWEMVFVD